MLCSTDSDRAVVNEVPTPKVAQFAAPKVKSIGFASHSPNYHGYEGIKIELDGAIPDDVYAIVISDSKGKARSWNAVTKGSKNVLVYNQWDCNALPNGTIPTKIGDKITLSWVNAHGRTSDRTQVMTIKAAPKP